MVSGRQVESGKGPIRYGMVGGGQGAFIGAVHRLAARMDGEFELVAGALSSNPERAKASAAELGLDPARSYGSFAEMAKAEAKRPDGIEAVAIVTPNNVHYPAAKAFLEAGIHVICDKPLTSNLADAKKLAALVEKIRQGVRADPQLHRLSDGAAGARHGGEGPARRHPRRAGRISAGLADRRPIEQTRPEAGGVAHRPETVGRGRRFRRHRHACLQSRPLRLGPRTRRAVGRSRRLRAGPQGRRQSQRAACASSRSARRPRQRA